MVICSRAIQLREPCPTNPTTECPTITHQLDHGVIHVPPTRPRSHSNPTWADFLESLIMYVNYGQQLNTAASMKFS